MRAGACMPCLPSLLAPQTDQRSASSRGANVRSLGALSFLRLRELGVPVSSTEVVEHYHAALPANLKVRECADNQERGWLSRSRTRAHASHQPQENELAFLYATHTTALPAPDKIFALVHCAA